MLLPCAEGGLYLVSALLALSFEHLLAWITELMEVYQNSKEDES